MKEVITASQFWSTIFFQQFTNHVITKSNMHFRPIFNCSNAPKVDIRRDWRLQFKVDQNRIFEIFKSRDHKFGEKNSGPKSQRHAYAFTWLPPSYIFGAKLYALDTRVNGIGFQDSRFWRDRFIQPSESTFSNFESNLIMFVDSKFDL